MEAILPEERSRLYAYEQAISIGEDAFSSRPTESARMQVIRSAAMVASGFRGTMKAQDKEAEA